MLIKSLKFSLLTCTSYLASCVLAGAAGVIYDFNAGQPAGTTVNGTAVVSPTNGIGNSGVLKITVNANSQGGGFTIPDFSSGAPVTNFRAKWKVLIGGGTDRPADGMSLSFGSGIEGASGSENGFGSGIIVSFDTWDNASNEVPPDTAPAIELRYNGAIVATQSMNVVSAAGTAMREGGRAPDGPILLDGNGNPVSLQTAPPASQNIPPTNFVDVEL